MTLLPDTAMSPDTSFSRPVSTSIDSHWIQLIYLERGTVFSVFSTQEVVYDYLYRWTLSMTFRAEGAYKAGGRQRLCCS